MTVVIYQTSVRLKVYFESDEELAKRFEQVFAQQPTTSSNDYKLPETIKADDDEVEENA